MLVLIAALVISLFASSVPAASPDPQTAQPPDPCLLKPEPEPCKAYFQMYYYNPDKGKCVFFGGCSSVVPFRKLEECRAACESGSSKEGSGQAVAEISRREYDVLEAVLKEHAPIPGWHVHAKTITTQLSGETVAFLARTDMPGEEGMKLDEFIVRDFNTKNRATYPLSPDFTVMKNATMFRSSGGPAIISLSRAGFDAEQKRAIVFLRDSYRVPPEVFIENEFFVLLERTGDSWKVIKKIQSSLKHS